MYGTVQYADVHVYLDVYEQIPPISSTVVGLLLIHCFCMLAFLQRGQVNSSASQDAPQALHAQVPSEPSAFHSYAVVHVKE